MKTLVVNKKQLLIKVLAFVGFTAAAIALPQIFHYIGLASGYGATVGSTFLPMHLPVLFAALFFGSAVGFSVGIVSPLLSFALSGMPAVVVLPFMMVELAAYGLFAGLLHNVKIPTLFKVLSAQIVGRVLKLAAIAVAIYAFNSTAVGLTSVWQAVVVGWPGIVLQLVLIPIVFFFVKRNDRKSL